MNEQEVRQREVHPLFWHGLGIIMAALLGMLGSATLYAQSEGATGAPVSSTRIVVEAPAQVRVGEVITIRLRAEGAIHVAGFEASIDYARSALEFAGFLPAPAANGTSMAQLVVPEMASGSVVGYSSCATAPCLGRGAEQAQVAAVAGTLGEVQLLALSAGQVEVKIAHLLLVDASGQPIAATLDRPSVTVQVGDGGPMHSAPMPNGAWAASGAQVGNGAASAPADADLTDDGNVTHSDLMDVAMAWQLAREAEQPCANGEVATDLTVDLAADLNGDNCVDVLDVQAAANLVGSGAAQATQIAAAKTYTVNSVLDEADADTTDGVCQSASGVCTLRAAIQQANVNPGSDLIHFAIAGSGVHTIQLTKRLPALSDTNGGVTIDGYSQPGAMPNSDPLVSNAQIRVEIRGGGAEAFDGLPITSAGNVIRGLAFYDLKRSLWIYGANASENAITGNFIGTNAAGTFAAAQSSEGQAHGIHVEKGAFANRIGGVTPAERNVVSGNARHGIGLWHVGTDENLIINNIVGLSPDGSQRIPNYHQGVDINYGARFNVVGGAEAGGRNVISGNGENGAEITHGETTTNNVIHGNFIGTDVTGEAAAEYTRNSGVGISLHDRIMDNLVTGNVIGNNALGGILIDNYGNCCTSNNRLEHNWIGVTPGGKAIGNGGYGIRLLAPGSKIGPGNVIAYNTVGVQLQGDGNDGNTITENSIYSNTGLGIDIEPYGNANTNDENDVDGGPNEQLNFPLITEVMPDAVTGRACGGCRVEVFIADEKSPQYGEGKRFLGAATANADGSFSVSIQNTAIGDYVTATATDANGNTSEFSQSVMVPDPANGQPIAVDDTAETLEGKAVVIDLLANDSDPDGDTLAMAAVGAPANGAVTIEGASVRYTPTASFVGQDSFTYIIGDGRGGSGEATVTVTVADDTSGTTGPGLTITPAELTLQAGDPPVSYTVMLNSRPAASVTVKIAAAAPLQVAPAELLFTPEDWNVPQGVMVGLANGEIAATQVSAIRHTVESADSDYGGMDAPTLTVTIQDGAAQSGDIFLPSIAR